MAATMVSSVGSQGKGASEFKSGNIPVSEPTVSPLPSGGTTLAAPGGGYATQSHNLVSGLTNGFKQVTEANKTTSSLLTQEITKAVKTLEEVKKQNEVIQKELSKEGAIVQSIKSLEKSMTSKFEKSFSSIQKSQEASFAKQIAVQEKSFAAQQKAADVSAKQAAIAQKEAEAKRNTAALTERIGKDDKVSSGYEKSSASSSSGSTKGKGGLGGAAAGGVLGALGAWLTGGDILGGAVGGAVGGAFGHSGLGAMLGTVFSKSLGNLSRSLLAGIGSLLEKLVTAIANVKLGGKTIGEWFSWMGNGIMNAFNWLKGPFWDTVTNIGGVISSVAGWLGKWFGKSDEQKKEIREDASLGIAKGGSALLKSKGALSKGVGAAAAKITGKQIAKRIPILGSALGVGFAGARALKGDWTGAAMELGSAGLGLVDLAVPGLGTALSAAADAGIAYRDIQKAKEGLLSDGVGGDKGDPPDEYLEEYPGFRQYVLDQGFSSKDRGIRGISISSDKRIISPDGRREINKKTREKLLAGYLSASMGSDSKPSITNSQQGLAMAGVYGANLEQDKRTVTNASSIAKEGALSGGETDDEDDGVKAWKGFTIVGEGGKKSRLLNGKIVEGEYEEDDEDDEEGFWSKIWGNLSGGTKDLFGGFLGGNSKHKGKGKGEVFWRNKYGKSNLKDGLITRIEQLADRYGVDLQVNSGFRSKEDQQSLIDRAYRDYGEPTKKTERGLTFPGNHVVNFPGSSPHDDGRAVDVNMVVDGKIIPWNKGGQYKGLQNEAKKLGLTSYNDTGHFQVSRDVGDPPSPEPTEIAPLATSADTGSKGGGSVSVSNGGDTYNVVAPSESSPQNSGFFQQELWGFLLGVNSVPAGGFV